MQQERDEPFRAFAAGVRGKAETATVATMSTIPITLSAAAIFC